MREEIYYWPLWTSYLLSKSEQYKIKTLIPKIQRAQVYLWRAINIYDDFLDGEGVKQELPKANSYYRKYLEIIYQLNLSDDYYRLFNKVFARLDKTNTQETSQQKIKFKNDYIIIPKSITNHKCSSSLCNKSLTLALGPIALLSVLKYKTNSLKIKSLLNFFKYFLSAKQLADDSYDWLEDLKNGLVTNANLPIIKAIQKRRLKINLKKSPEMANLLYAKESSLAIITESEFLCNKARQAMKNINNNEKNKLVNELILPLENACRKAKKFQSLISQV